MKTRPDLDLTYSRLDMSDVCKNATGTRYISLERQNTPTPSKNRYDASFMRESLTNRLFRCEVFLAFNERYCCGIDGPPCSTVISSEGRRLSFRGNNKVGQARFEDAASTPTARPPAEMSRHHKETDGRSVILTYE